MLSRMQLLTYGFAIALAASLPQFWTTPNSILQDSAEYIPLWEGRSLNQWHSVLIPPYFFDLSWYHLGFRWGGYGAERVLGLGFAFCLLGALTWWSITSRQALPVVFAVLVATRYGLWTQRHHLGMEMLLGQACLIYALQRHYWFRGACIAAIGPWLYLCCCVWVAYPAVWLWGRWSAMRRCYVLLGILLIPFVWNLIQFRFPFHAETSGHWSWALLRHRIIANGMALYDERYSAESSWMWSYPGAQRFPVFILTCCGVGMLVALWSGGGRRWLATLGLGFVPSLISISDNASSHRQVMILLPIAVLTGMSLCVLPHGWRGWSAVLLGTAMAIVGVSDWLDPAFWLPWNTGTRTQGFSGFWHQPSPPLHLAYPIIGVAAVGVGILFVTYFAERAPRCT